MLSALLSRWADAAQPDRRSPGDSAGQLSDIALFDAIVGEVHQTALQTAAMASILNGLAAGRHSGRARAILDFVPHKPAAIAGLRQCRHDLALSQHAVCCIDVLYREAAMARPAIYHFVGDLERHGAVGASDRHAKGLAATWRRLAKAALDAVEALEPEARRHLGGHYHGNALILRRLLRAAGDGKQPCVDAKGEIFVPQLPQRRATRRFALLQRCIVHHRGARLPAFARDVSCTGLGLDHPGLGLRQVVNVELTDGRMLSGTVIWANHGRAGIEFLTPLAPNDPLIAG
jgi:hypothetical protein